jgi:2-phosphosulfolactate phosphatase
MNRTLEVILSPALLPYHDVKGKSVYVIDVLRATTSICVAFQSGVKRILPVATPEECLVFKDFDFLCAAERNAIKLQGFDMGNSPFEFQNPLLAGRSIAFTTTNGTRSIKLAREMQAADIYIAAFLNLKTVAAHIQSHDKSVILLCSGWKDKANMEDTLLAGAIVSLTNSYFQSACDVSILSSQLYQFNEKNLLEMVRQSSHAKRFALLDAHHDDVAFCLQHNLLDLLPRMQGEYLVV